VIGAISAGATVRGMPTGSFVVVDLETNPGHSDILQHEIVEIGSVLVEDGGVVDRFECLVQPQRRFSAVEQRITRLGESRSGDRNGSGDRPCLRVLSLRDALAGLIEFCGDRPLVAHNGFGYDFPILDEAARRERLPPRPGGQLSAPVAPPDRPGQGGGPRRRWSRRSWPCASCGISRHRAMTCTGQSGDHCPGGGRRSADP